MDTERLNQILDLLEEAIEEGGLDLGEKVLLQQAYDKIEAVVNAELVLDFDDQVICP